jgi:phosphoglucosamine mutase
MSALFGTVGVRGLANVLITVEVSMARDPQFSWDYISSAMAAGMAGAGVDVFDAGVIPTPATAFLVADLAAAFGVMISASHNPAHNNGIQ